MLAFTFSGMDDLRMDELDLALQELHAVVTCFRVNQKASTFISVGAKNLQKLSVN